MTAQPPEPQASTAYKVAAGTAMFMIMRWCFRLIGLASTIVLARVLVPEDFGLFAVAASYITLIDGLTDLSIRSSVVRHGGSDRQFLDTVFTIQLLRAVIVSAVVAGTSLILPMVIQDDRVTSVILCLALNTLWGGLMNPQMAVFERELDFRRELLMQFAGKLLSTVAAIAFALIYQSYWALVVGSLVGSFTRVTLSYVLSPFLPRLTLSHWRKLFAFAGWLSAATTADTLGHELDSIIIGGFLDLRSAGIYKVGSEFANLPLGEFLPVLTRTLFPGLLKFKDDIPKLRQNTLDGVEVICTLSFPIAAGFAFVAPETVRILYGANWVDAIPIVQAIAICSGIEAIGSSVTTSVAMATDNTKLLFRRSVVRSLCRLPAFVLGAWLYGIPGALFGYFVGSVLFASANISILSTLLQASYAAMVGRIWRATVAVAVMSGAVALVPASEGTGIGDDVAMIGIKIAVGVFSYAAVRLLLWWGIGRPEFSEVIFARIFSEARRTVWSRLGRNSKRD